VRLSSLCLVGTYSLSKFWLLSIFHLLFQLEIYQLLLKVHQTGANLTIQLQLKRFKLELDKDMENAVVNYEGSINMFTYT